MYFGTLDYATARFNTILLKLSQDEILAHEHKVDVHDCYDTIQTFYRNVQRYDTWPRPFKFLIAIVLHAIGRFEIPKIKRLLKKLDN